MEKVVIKMTYYKDTKRMVRFKAVTDDAPVTDLYISKKVAAGVRRITVTLEDDSA